MPTISMFYGILIRMYYDEHNTPHFHAIYNEYKAIFNFNGEIMEGNFPIKETKLIQAWIIIHQDELKANWKLLEEKQNIFSIKPLE